jgi:hypothetical protein
MSGLEWCLLLHPGIRKRGLGIFHLTVDDCLACCNGRLPPGYSKELHLLPGGEPQPRSNSSEAVDRPGAMAWHSGGGGGGGRGGNSRSCAAPAPAAVGHVPWSISQAERCADGLSQAADGGPSNSGGSTGLARAANGACDQQPRSLAGRAAEHARGGRGHPSGSRSARAVAAALRSAGARGRASGADAQTSVMPELSAVAAAATAEAARQLRREGAGGRAAAAQEGGHGQDGGGGAAAAAGGQAPRGEAPAGACQVFEYEVEVLAVIPGGHRALI